MERLRGLNQRQDIPDKERHIRITNLVLTRESRTVKKIRPLIQAHPKYRYRRIEALLRHRAGIAVNRKGVYRILKVKR